MRESLDDIPSDPDRQFVNLMKIVDSHNTLMADMVAKLWKLCTNSMITRGNLFTTRFLVYNYYRESERPEDWQQILVMFRDVPRSMLTELDYRFNLWALFRLDLINLAPGVFLESVKHFPLETQMQWLMIQRYCTNSDNFAPLFIMWCIHNSQTDPRLRHDRTTSQDELRRMLVGIASHQQTQLISSFEYILEHLELFGRRVSRMAISILAELEAPMMAKEIYVLLRRYAASPADLTAIVNILIDAAMPKEASELIADYEFQDLDSTSANAVIGCKLKTLAALGDFTAMQRLFESIENPRSDHYNIVMKALGKIGRIDLVNALFDNLLSQDEVIDPSSLQTLMWCRVQVGDIHGARKIFDSLGEFDMTPDTVMYNLMLKAYKDTQDPYSMFTIFVRMISEDVEVNYRHITTMMSLYANIGSVAGVESVFEYLERLEIKPDAGIFNMILLANVRGCGPHEFSEAVERVRERMREADVRPNAHVYGTTLYGHAERDDAEGVKRTIAEMNLSGVQMNAVTYGVMIHYLAMLGQFDAAESLVERLPSLGIRCDAYHYTALMSGYLKHDLPEKVTDLYRTMVLEGLQPTFVTMFMVIMASLDKKPQNARKSLAEAIQRYIPSFPTADMTSKTIPKTVVPSFIFTEALRQYRPNTHEGLESYKQFMSLHDSSRGRSFLSRGAEPDVEYECYLIIAARDAEDWLQITHRWRKRVLPKFRKSHRIFDSTSGRFTKEIRGLDMRLLAQAAAAQMEALTHLRKYKEAEKLWLDIRRKYKIPSTSKVWNARVRALVEMPGRSLEAFEISEKYLSAGTLERLEWQKMAKRRRTSDLPDNEEVKELPRVHSLDQKSIGVLSEALIRLYRSQRTELSTNPAESTQYQRVVSQCPLTRKLIRGFRESQRIKRTRVNIMGTSFSNDKGTHLRSDRLDDWQSYRNAVLGMKGRRTIIAKERTEEIQAIYTQLGKITPQMWYDLQHVGKMSAKDYDIMVERLKANAGRGKIKS